MRASSLSKKVDSSFGARLLVAVHFFFLGSLFFFCQGRRLGSLSLATQELARMASLAPWRCCSSARSPLTSSSSSSAANERRSNSAFFFTVVAVGMHRRSGHRRPSLRVAQVRCRGVFGFYCRHFSIELAVCISPKSWNVKSSASTKEKRRLRVR